VIKPDNYVDVAEAKI